MPQFSSILRRIVQSWCIEYPSSQFSVDKELSYLHNLFEEKIYKRNALLKTAILKN